MSIKVIAKETLFDSNSVLREAGEEFYVADDYKFDVDTDPFTKVEAEAEAPAKGGKKAKAPDEPLA